MYTYQYKIRFHSHEIGFQLLSGEISREKELVNANTIFEALQEDIKQTSDIESFSIMSFALKKKSSCKLNLP